MQQYPYGNRDLGSLWGRDSGKVEKGREKGIGHIQDLELYCRSSSSLNDSSLFRVVH